MQTVKPRWSLIGTSTNSHGVTFFTVACRGAIEGNADYHELMSVLNRHFGAIETGQSTGPYSEHRYVIAEGLSFTIILDWPDWLDLCAGDQRDVASLESLVTRLIEALNQESISNNTIAGMTKA